jgi:hypothetical protein
VKIITFKHGIKSYDVVEYIFNILFPARYDLTVVDLTYGKGRFYKKVRHRINMLIGVDILRHDWEVKPDVFYTMSCQEFTAKVLKGEMQPPRADLIVVDPPWDTTKRGLSTVPIRLLEMPYHMYVKPSDIVYTAMVLSKHLRIPLLYRYREPLKCNKVIDARAEVKLFGTRGFVYYGVCTW